MMKQTAIPNDIGIETFYKIKKEFGKYWPIIN